MCTECLKYSGFDFRKFMIKTLQRMFQNNNNDATKLTDCASNQTAKNAQ